jgi:hypothetical protein
VAAYRSALSVWTRDRAPRLWAQIQNKIGDTLFMLDEREDRPARLEEAVATYRLAVLDWTSEKNSEVMGGDAEQPCHFRPAVA